MPFRGSGPGQKPAFEMHWHTWVVLIAGSPALHYVLFALPTFRSRRKSARSRSRRECDGFFVAITLAITAHAILAILLASEIAATLVGRRANNAVSQGQCLVPWILA